MHGKGKVSAISGQIVEVEFADNPPMIHDVLVLESDPTLRMEVHSSAGVGVFYALLLTPSNILARGSVVLNTNDAIRKYITTLKKSCKTVLKGPAPSAGSVCSYLRNWGIIIPTIGAMSTFINIAMPTMGAI